jgi:hypothetical protein
MNSFVFLKKAKRDSLKILWANLIVNPSKQVTLVDEEQLDFSEVWRDTIVEGSRYCEIWNLNIFGSRHIESNFCLKRYH